MRPSHRRTGAVGAAVALSLSMLAAPGLAAAAPNEPPQLNALPLAGALGDPSISPQMRVDPEAKAAAQDPQSSLPPALRNTTGPTTVFVRLDMAAVLDGPGGTARGPEASQAAATEAAIESKADEIVAEIDGAQKVHTTTNVIAGVTLETNAEGLQRLAERPDVVSIKPVTRVKRTNAASAVLTEAVSTWQQQDLTGEGVRIAIIDGGVDYTHAAFGGPGTVEAFDEAQASPTPVYPPNKFEAGTDLAGDDYFPSMGIGATPDANPLDCRENGHGTHVAATAAGYGVNADGSTVTADFTALTQDDVMAMRIGPGTAPDATIIPIKIFGCEGDSDLVLEGLDEAAASGAEVINLSLGTDYAPADDPVNDFVDALSEKGILTVAATGNGGDLVDVGGSPASAKSALAVASSASGITHADAIEIMDPGTSSLTDGSIIPGSFGFFTLGNADFGEPSLLPIEGEVTALSDPANTDGCDPLSVTDAARVAGKIVMLGWNDDTWDRCLLDDDPFVKYNNLLAAGAIGAIDSPIGIQLPGSQTLAQFFLLPSDSADVLATSADQGVRVRFGPELVGAVIAELGTTDELSDFSSRGIHGSTGLIKPDITAPGDATFSAQAGSGSEGMTGGGTSMASPHVAGIAALLVEQRPEWSALQLKAGLMNTATQDLHKGDDVNLRYGPNRAGAGRVDALQAAANPVLAYDGEDPSQVTSTFGILEVGETPLSATRAVTIENTSDAAIRLRPSFEQATEIEGVEYSVSPSEVEVPAQGKASVTVTLTVADPTMLRKNIDPTSDPNSLFHEDTKRDYVPLASGRLILRATSAGTNVPEDGVRVPVAAVVRPASAMAAAGPVEFADASATSQPLALTGYGLAQGPADDTASYHSVLVPLELAAVSPKLAKFEEVSWIPSARAGDLEYVGVASTVPQLAPSASDAEVTDQAVLQFGISTYQAMPALDIPITTAIEFDTNNNGIVDYITYVERDNLWRVFFDDRYVATTVRASDSMIMSSMPVNALEATTDSNIFDTNALSIPVRLSALGFSPDEIRDPDTSIKYSVKTVSEFTDAADAVIDSVPGLQFNPAKPGLWFSSPGEAATVFADKPGTITVNRNGGEERSALLLHLHNQMGERAEVVKARTRGDATISLDKSSVERGNPVTIAGSGYDAGSSVEVTLHSVPVALGTATVAADGTFAVTATIPASTTTGSHTIVAAGGARTASAELTITAAGEAGTGGPTPGTTVGAAKPAAKGSGLAITGAHIGSLLALAILAGTAGMLLLRRQLRTSPIE